MPTYTAIADRGFYVKALQRSLGVMTEGEARRIALHHYAAKAGVLTVKLIRRDAEGLSKSIYDAASGNWSDWT